MKKFIGIAALVLAAAFSTGCTRISDGEVGVRVGFGGEISQTELGTGYPGISPTVLWLIQVLCIFRIMMFSL